MYEFAVITLLGLVTLKVTDLVVDNAPGLDRIRTFLTFILATVFVVALDHSMFEAFGIPVREAWMGVVGTGLVIGALSSAWSALLGWLGTSSVNGTKKAGNERPRMAA